MAAALAAELARGCGDLVVLGGVDALLAAFADGPAGDRASRLAASLPPGGYGAMRPRARRAWIGDALDALARPRAEDPPAPPAPPPAPRAKPPRPARSRARPPAPAEAADGGDADPDAPAALDADPMLLPLGDAGLGLSGRHLGRLAAIGVADVGGLLRHYPNRHVDFTRTAPVSRLRDGERATVAGEIVSVARAPGPRGMTTIGVRDDRGDVLRVLWFNMPYLYRQLPRGSAIAVAGKVSLRGGRPSMANPEFDLPGSDGGSTGRLLPVYASTRGLPQRRLRDAAARALERYAGLAPEPLPAGVREEHGLPSAAEALRGIHRPESYAQRTAAAAAIAFADLTAIQLGVVRRRRRREAETGAPPIRADAAVRAFVSNLPFGLTAGQRGAARDILSDLARERPMERLLQGDVGSGKTAVALAAMLACAAAGRQAVLMAPTEVLADQHHRTVSALLAGERGAAMGGVVQLPYPPGKVYLTRLTGSSTARERRGALSLIRSGTPAIVVGTHSLIQKGVEFGAPGLAVVDEQHRFGVRQRAALRGASAAGPGASPHLLAMTATPIPRTLALTVFGDLDVSAIPELPPGRAAPETVAVPQPPAGDAGAAAAYARRREEAFRRVRAEVEAGRQAYVVCPLVGSGYADGEDGEDDGEARSPEDERKLAERASAAAATAEHERVRREVFPDLADRVALLHGRMPGRAKEAALRGFAAGETSVLVSTAVVEVGIDVPNATAMVVLGANRFGLAQLHQLRGRIGRGGEPSVCFLLGDPPRPRPAADAEGEERRRAAAAERLALAARVRDGFALAQADLELRDFGDPFGVRQAGRRRETRFIDMLRPETLARTRAVAEAIDAADPGLEDPEHAALRSMLARAEASGLTEAH